MPIINSSQPRDYPNLTVEDLPIDSGFITSVAQYARDDFIHGCKALVGRQSTKIALIVNSKRQNIISHFYVMLGESAATMEPVIRTDIVPLIEDIYDICRAIVEKKPEDVLSRIFVPPHPSRTGGTGTQADSSQQSELIRTDQSRLPNSNGTSNELSILASMIDKIQKHVDALQETVDVQNADIEQLKKENQTLSEINSDLIKKINNFSSFKYTNFKLNSFNPSSGTELQATPCDSPRTSKRKGGAAGDSGVAAGVTVSGDTPVGGGGSKRMRVNTQTERSRQTYSSTLRRNLTMNDQSGSGGVYSGNPSVSVGRQSIPRPSSNEVVNENNQTGNWQIKAHKRFNRLKKATVGTGMSSQLKAASRPWYIYTSNWSCDTKTSDLVEHLKTFGVEVDAIEELEVKSKRYKSFKVTCDSKFRQNLESTGTWPIGIVARRFYMARITNTVGVTRTEESRSITSDLNGQLSQTNPPVAPGKNASSATNLVENSNMEI